MSNNTSFNCPNDIAQLQITDFRPSKSLYENISDNNSFRLYLQRNGNKIRQMQLDQFEGKLSCCDCEAQPNGMVQFNKGYSCRGQNPLKR